MFRSQHHPTNGNNSSGDQTVTLLVLLLIQAHPRTMKVQNTWQSRGVACRRRGSAPSHCLLLICEMQSRSAVAHRKMLRCEAIVCVFYSGLPANNYTLGPPVWFTGWEACIRDFTNKNSANILILCSATCFVTGSFQTHDLVKFSISECDGIRRRLHSK